MTTATLPAQVSGYDLYRWLDQAELAPGERSVALSLLTRAYGTLDWRTKDAVSVRTLAAGQGYSRRHTRRLLAALEDRGLIRRIHRPWQASLYQVLPEALFAAAQDGLAAVARFVKSSLAAVGLGAKVVKAAPEPKAPEPVDDRLYETIVGYALEVAELELEAAPLEQVLVKLRRHDQVDQAAVWLAHQRGTRRKRTIRQFAERIGPWWGKVVDRVAFDLATREREPRAPWVPPNHPAAKASSAELLASHRWKQALGVVLQQADKDAQRWLERLEPVHVEDGRLLLTAPHEPWAHYVADHYLPELVHQVGRVAFTW